MFFVLHRQLFIVIFLSFGSLTFTFAQAKKSYFGPVVAAYLTSLREELSELDYQLQHREITREEHTLSKARFVLLRRLVQERAQKTHVDFVPELQALTLGEFGMVGLSQPPEPDKLQLGQVFDESWQLISIEATKPQFFVFEKVPMGQNSTSERMIERPSNKAIDPALVIETIVVPDPPYLRPAASRPRKVSGNE